MNIFTWRNRPKTCYEHFDPKDPSSLSRTVPDQSLTISDLINRYTRGQSLPGDMLEESGYETPDEVPLDLPDLEKMSKVEKAQFSMDNLEEIEAASVKLKERDKEIKNVRGKIAKAKAKAKVEAKVETKVANDEKKD